MPRHDDDDDRPRRRRRDEDDDDRPRRRSRNDDEDDRPRSRRKGRRDDYDQYEDRPRRKSRPMRKEPNVVGLIGLIIGIASLFVAFIPCMGWFAIAPALVGLVIGFIGLMVAQKSEGRQGSGLPFAAMGVSFAAVVIAVGWLLLFKGVEKVGERMIAEAQAERKAELDKSAKEVQAATNPVRVTAEMLARDYDQDAEQADARYRGKVLEVTGTVEQIDLDEDDVDVTYQVMLKTGIDDTIDCDFTKNPEIRARLAQLKPGTRVTIRGKCIGYTMLEACILVN